MRFIASLLFLFPASAAMAFMPPGPPPWSCSVRAACNAADMCVFLLAIPVRFKLTRIEGDAGKYHLEGSDGFEQTALELPSLEDAKHFAETYSSVELAPLILIRNDMMSDTNSFWLQTMARRANGQHIMMEEKMLVACNSIRKR